MEYRIIHDKLSTDDYIKLFSFAGWGEPDRGLVEKSLKNSYVTFSVTDGDKVIAMARLIGDGGMAFFLKDLIVAPEYQGKGVGRELMCHIEDYIRGELEEGWECRFQLISAKDKEEFYRKCGYIAHPHEHSGPGFTKLIRKEK